MLRLHPISYQKPLMVIEIGSERLFYLISYTHKKIKTYIIIKLTFSCTAQNQKSQLQKKITPRVNIELKTKQKRNITRLKFPKLFNRKVCSQTREKTYENND